MSYPCDTPEFWKHAPESAMYYAEDEHQMAAGWYKTEGDRWFFATETCPTCWLPVPGHPGERRLKLHPRPTTPAWDGEGLPPEGVECEFTAFDPEFSHLDGRRCFIIGNGKDAQGNDVTTAQFGNDGYQAFASECFVPLESPAKRLGELLDSAVHEWLQKPEVQSLMRRWGEVEHRKRCRRIVASWPAWKRDFAKQCWLSGFHKDTADAD